MDLVTVTCLLDKEQMLLQAESISKFLEPCRHWVVINDRNQDKEYWEQALSQYYTRHELKIITPNLEKYYTFNQYENGWKTQQVLKYEIFKHVKDDYLILDSKNFFIKNSRISDWQSVAGCGFKENYTKKIDTWGPTIDNYSLYMDISPNYRQLAMQTPFVFRNEVLSKIENFEEFLKWFNSNEVLTSEFLFYSILQNKHALYKDNKILKTQHWNILSKHKFDDFTTIKDYFFDNPAIKVAGLHRNFLSKLTAKEQTAVNDWITSLGLTRLFK
jgi:hypothetical protein